jgi:hypothetical protein
MTTTHTTSTKETTRSFTCLTKARKKKEKEKIIFYIHYKLDIIIFIFTNSVLESTTTNGH